MAAVNRTAVGGGGAHVPIVFVDELSYWAKYGDICFLFIPAFRR
jgi:hypothetical protein